MMNEDVLKGKWSQLKGTIQEKWGDLTDDDIDKIDGQRERLVGQLQEKYGHTKEEARKQVNDFLK